MAEAHVLEARAVAGAAAATALMMKYGGTGSPSKAPHQRSPRLALDAAFPRLSQPVMTMRRRVDVNLDELDQIIRSQHARAAERIGRPEA